MLLGWPMERDTETSATTDAETPAAGQGLPGLDHARSAEASMDVDAQPSLIEAEVQGSPSRSSSHSLAGVPRLVRAERSQIEWREAALDDLVAEDHVVRSVWAFVERLDLSGFEAPIRSVEGHAGRPAADPRVLLALWLYATAEGVGSARELDRLTREHLAFRWLRGGVPLDYHTLSEFRTAHRQAMDELLTQVLAVMTQERILELKRVAQDGTRVRASAGAASFHRRTTLERHLAEAQAQVSRLAAELESPDPMKRRREQAAAERAARERKERIERAISELPKVEEVKRRNGSKAEARVSSTDPEARVMKMGDGGFRPAYNVQLATDAGSQAIVGVAVTNQGTDAGQMPPMLEQIEKRTGRKPEEMLVDGGFTDHDSLAAAAEKGVTAYAPVPEPKDPKVDRYRPKPDDSPSVAAWRERMGTEEAKAIYKDRAATAECVNAIAKEHRGLTAFRVRGIEKVLSVALLFAVTHNILRYLALANG